MNDKLNITSRLKTALNTKEIKQKDLCLNLGIAPSTFNNWINMNRSIPAEFIIPICEFINIDFYWLLTGKEEQSKTSQIITKEIPLKLTVDEDNLLDLYQNTTIEGQKIIQKTVRTIWAENQRPKSKSSNTHENEITVTKQMA